MSLIQNSISLIALAALNGLIFSVPLTAQAETLYVQAGSTALLAEPKMGSAKILELKRGDSLEVIEKKEPWVQVKHGKGDGWISRLFLSPHQPVGAADLNKEVHVSLEKASRRRSSSYTVAAAARGLNADERVREGRELYRADFSELEAIERFELPKGQLDKFRMDAQLK